MEIKAASDTAYTCVTGHMLDASKLDDTTEVRQLDGGAIVRICREHGAPIAITRYGRASVREPEDSEGRPSRGSPDFAPP